MKRLVSMLSDAKVSVEVIARLIGHRFPWTSPLYPGSTDRFGVVPAWKASSTGLLSSVYCQVGGAPACL